MHTARKTSPPTTAKVMRMAFAEEIDDSLVDTLPAEELGGSLAGTLLGEGVAITTAFVHTAPWE